MKRWIACLMACMLAAFALNAWAAEYTLDEKLIKQVKDGSGLKVTVKMDKTGGSFTSLDAQTNLALNALLPGAELSLRFLRGVGTIKGMQDLEITLTKGGEPLAGMRSLRDTQFESLTSSLLGGITYADVRGGGALMAMLLDQDPAWPPLEGVLLKLLLAESTWQTAANRKLDAYQLKLSLWLQGFTQTETVRAEDNTLRTRVLVSVPAAQLKNQIKQLLVDMFNDAELLSLLSRELNGREAAAFLQPGMLNGFFSSLDLLPLSGNIISERVMDNLGTLVENRIILPMGGARGIRQIDYVYTAGEEGGETRLSLAYEPQNAANEEGSVLRLQMTGSPLPDALDSMNYIGSLVMQPEADPDDFTVDQTMEASPGFGYNFRLYYSPEPEMIDVAQGTSTRDFEANLLITPQGEDMAAGQNFRLRMQLQSRQSSRAATYFTGSLVWQDMATQAQVEALISGNTAPPWAIPAVDITAVARVDALSQTQFEGLREQVRQTIKTAFTQLLLSLSVPVSQP